MASETILDRICNKNINDVTNQRFQKSINSSKVLKEIRDRTARVKFSAQRLTDKVVESAWKIITVWKQAFT